MTTKTLQALLLHKQWSGDSSVRAHFFTRELGVISCLCKGGRAPKKQALLQAFIPLWVGVDARYDRYFARSIESTESRLDLNGNALFSGLYLNELLYYAIKPSYPDPELFDAYWATLQALAQAKDKQQIEPVLRRFEWTLVKTCGYSFSLTTEAQTDTPISASLYYDFRVGEGFVPQSSGIPGEHILALSEDNLTEESYRKTAKLIMRKAIDQVVGGREIKARALYK